MKKSIDNLTVNELRTILKTVMKNEIENLPATLEHLDPKERASTICKLVPYVFPKVDSVNAKQGEPFEF